MYKRNVTAPPKQVIKNGQPQFGTFYAPFKSLDIRNVRHPFGNLPFPKFITNLRIRAGLIFSFLVENYIGVLEIFDAKLFSYAEVTLWNMQTAKKSVYRKVIGPRRRLIPKSLETGTCIVFSNKRYIRLSWNRAQNRFSVLLNLFEHDVSPHVSAAFNVDLLSHDFAQLACVNPAPIKRRCSAAYQFCAPIKGSLSVGEETFSHANGIGYFTMLRSYFGLRTKYDYILGMGFIEKKIIAFKISTSSLAAVDEDSYNENVLFFDGKVTPLPPVKITHPLGVSGNWIIQDTESMIDLCFNPISDNRSSISALVIRSEYHTMYGVFEGTVISADNETIPIKDFKGIGKILRLRL